MVLVEPCVPEQCGKAFRSTLYRPSPNLPCPLRKQKVRLVPAFTIQALQRNTKVIPPPKSSLFDFAPLKDTKFKKYYLRGEFPISIEIVGGMKKINWKVPIEKLDYHHYLPLFFEGLAEMDYPYTFFVQRGIQDLIAQGSYKVLPVVPQIIIPIKGALNTRRPAIICNVCRSLMALVSSCERVGEALVPYFRQLLPTLNLFKDRPEYAGTDTGDLIEECLQTLERYGGVDAFINIKYMVPTYESSVMN